MEYLFGDLTLDLGRRELRRGEAVIGIQPQVFDLLVYLVENRHRLVSKDDLIAGVWQGRIVSDSTLASRINAARRAIGDSGESQTLIRTLSRKGIRFVGDVHVLSDGQVAPVGDQPANGQASPEFTSEGAPPAEQLTLGAPLHQRSSLLLGRMLGGGLAAAMAVLLGWQFMVSIGTPPANSTVEVATAEPAVPSGMISVAVLPFANLSSDAAQEFFSDGITEEITSALARIPNLHVVARTSASAFKGENRKIQDIARALNATHVIEGSVRKVDNQVRITAQLIQADSGLHVWTSSYDRELVNIFAIQEEIAQAIAGALRVPLGLAPGERLVSNRSVDPESYQQYLRAKALVHQRRGPNQGNAYQGLTEAVRLLEPVVARVPDFAPAWAQLAQAYQRIPAYTEELEYASVEEKRRAANEWLAKAEEAAKRAIQLDANLPDGYSSLGLTMALRGRLLLAEELLFEALALDPFSPEAMQVYANLLGAVARTKEALALKQQLLSMEPFVEAYNGGVRDLLWTSGQTDTLITRLKATSSAIDFSYLAQLHSVQGRYTEAADALMAIPPGSYPEGMVEAAVRLLRTAPAGGASPRVLPRLGDRLDFIYIHVGVPERVLERFEDGVAAGFSQPNLITRLWSPIYAPVRKTERFKTFARDAGLVEYWRAKGWPNFCRPTTGDDFVCD